MPERQSIAFYAFQVIRKGGFSMLKALKRLRETKPLNRPLALDLGAGKVRLEDIRKENSSRWLLDFSKPRDKGAPAIAPEGEALRGYDFAPNERPAQEVAVLCDPSTNHMIIQFNQLGIKHRVIGDYLNRAFRLYCNGRSGDSCDLLYSFDPDVDQKIRQKRNVKSFEITMAPRLFGDSDHFDGTFMDEAIQMADQSGCARVKISLSMAQSGGFLDSSVGRVVRALWERRRRETHQNDAQTQGIPGVRTLKARIADESDSQTELVDILTQRLCYQEDVEIHAGDRRPLREKRYAALKNAHDRWHHDFTRSVATPRR